MFGLSPANAALPETGAVRDWRRILTSSQNLCHRCERVDHAFAETNIISYLHCSNGTSVHNLRLFL